MLNKARISLEFSGKYILLSFCALVLAYFGVSVLWPSKDSADAYSVRELPTLSVSLSESKISLNLSDANTLRTQDFTATVTTHGTSSFSSRVDFSHYKLFGESSSEIPTLSEPVNVSSFPSDAWGYSRDNSTYYSITTPLEYASHTKVSDNVFTDSFRIGAKRSASTPSGLYEARIIYTAIATAQTFSISYHGNTPDSSSPTTFPSDWSGDITASRITEAISDVVPAHDYYEFSGWSLSPDGPVTLSPGSVITLDSSVNHADIYAIWSDSCVMYLHSNNPTGGASTRKEMPFSCKAGFYPPADVSGLDGFAYTNYKFKGWSFTAGGAEGLIPTTAPLMVPGRTLYAQWEHSEPDCKVDYTDGQSVLKVSTEWLSEIFAIDSNGHIWDWGWGAYGRGSQHYITTPYDFTDMFGGKTLSDLASGSNYSFAIDTDGHLWAWGDNNNGEFGGNLGIGTSFGVYDPIDITDKFNGKTIRKIASGGAHSLAIDSDGHLWSWGSNYDGELGNNSYTRSSTPIDITSRFGGKTIKEISAGDSHSLAIDSENHLWFWGEICGERCADHPAPMDITDRLGGATASSISSGDTLALVVDSNGHIWIWGYLQHGIYYKNGSSGTTATEIPIDITEAFGNGSKTFSSASIKNWHGLAIDTENHVWAWGWNVYGELGDNKTANDGGPVDITSRFGGSTIASVFAGENHTSFAVDSNGQLWAWGFNGNGELGNGTTVDSHVPIKILNKTITEPFFCSTGHTIKSASDFGWSNDSLVFKDWTDSAGGNISAGTVIHESKTLTANWKEKSATACSSSDKICYDKNGADGGSMSEQNITANSSVTLYPSNFWRSGYGFAGWNTKPDGTGTQYGPMETITTPSSLPDDGIRLYARWIPSAGSLQNWTGCSGMSIGTVTALTDQRDNDTYAVAKLADGNCWMIENLRLDNDALHNSDGSLAQGYASGFIGLANPEIDNFADSTIANSLYDTNLISGSYQDHRFPRYNNKNTASPATNTTTNQNIYSYGNYYTWSAAIADTGNYTVKGQIIASTSICPKGWKLPTGNDNGILNTDYSVLDVALGGSGTSTVEASNHWRKYPNNYILPGYLFSSSTINAGISGEYWSSTSHDINSPFVLYIAEYGIGPGTNQLSKNLGASIRCLIPGSTTHTVSFDGNGATSGSLENMQVEEGTTFTLPESPYSKSDENYFSDFSGWSTAKSDIIGYLKPNTASPVINADTVFYAIWQGEWYHPETNITAKFGVHMQDLDHETLSHMKSPLQYKMTDRRDGKSYYVSRWSDDYVFMTQNLDFDIPASGLSTLGTDYLGNANQLLSDINYEYYRRDGNTFWDSRSKYPPAKTMTLSEFRTDTKWYTSTDSYSVNPGDCYSADGRSSYATRDSEYIITGCANTSGDPHYHIGNFYNYTTATAGTGTDLVNADARDSVCPAGWTLPKGSDYEAYDGWSNAISSIGLKFDLWTLNEYPLYFVRGGSTYDEGRIGADGETAFYYSSSAGESNTAYNLVVEEWGGSWGDKLFSRVTDSAMWRYSGASVRCVSRKLEDKTYYSVKFSGNTADSGSLASKGVESGKTFTLPDNPYSKSGHIFLYYSDKSDGTGLMLYPGDESPAITKNMTLYAIWAPYIGYMQDFSSETADSMTKGVQYIARDRRDEKSYFVAKLADDSIWMTQNLDLDIPATGLDSTLSDISYFESQFSDQVFKWDSSSTFAPSATSKETITPADANSATSVDYGGDTDYCYDSASNSLKSCHREGNHMHTGNYYQYTAAAAGSMDDTSLRTYPESPDSICPRGWRLQEMTATDKEASRYGLGYVLAEEKAANDFSRFIGAPFYFAPVDEIYPEHILSDVGAAGYYWGSQFGKSGSTTQGGFVRIKKGETTIYADARLSALRAQLPVRCVFRNETRPVLGYMQDIDSTIISNMEMEKDYIMVDKRDKNPYLVTKLADGNVWMTQNLAYDLDPSIPLTSETSDIGYVKYKNNKGSSSWTPPYSTAAYNATNSGTGTGFGSKNRASECYPKVSSSGWYCTGTLYHSSSGVYYEYDAATAGSSKDISAYDSDDSICPAGWTIPASSYVISKTRTIKNLIDAYSITDYASVISSPFKIPYGNASNYWTSTTNANYYNNETTYRALESYFGSSPNDNYILSKTSPNPVRCVTRDSHYTWDAYAAVAGPRSISGVSYYQTKKDDGTLADFNWALYDSVYLDPSDGVVKASGEPTSHVIFTTQDVSNVDALRGKYAVCKDVFAGGGLCDRYKATYVYVSDQTTFTPKENSTPNPDWGDGIHYLEIRNIQFIGPTAGEYLGITTGTNIDANPYDFNKNGVYYKRQK